MLASPWNYIYSAAELEKDPTFYEKNVMGTGPFKFVEYVPGSHWVGKRNEEYFDQGKPYLDGFRALFIRETAAQVAAVRGERAHVEFRGFTPQARDDLVQALGQQDHGPGKPLDLGTDLRHDQHREAAVRRRRASARRSPWRSIAGRARKALSKISLPKYRRRR